MIDPVALALNLVRFDTMSPPGNEDACPTYLADLRENAAFGVTRHAFAPGRTSLVAHLAGARDDLAPLAFTGHLDTVPLGTRQWSFDPRGEIRDGRLFGRGASDMKGGVAAFVAASIEAAGQNLSRGNPHSDGRRRDWVSRCRPARPSQGA
jgi:succinyl-diaminopimelate desuccinylase